MSPMVTSAPEVRANAPGHTVLYRGGYETSIKAIFDEDGQVVKMTPLFSGRPRDFNSTKKASYMALDFEIANNRLHHSLAKFGRATLAIGTICGKPNIVITNLPSPVEITHQMILQGPRGDAVQYVFIDDQGVDFLETHGSSTCTVHPMTRHVVEEIESGMN